MQGVEAFKYEPYKWSDASTQIQHVANKSNKTTKNTHASILKSPLSMCVLLLQCIPPRTAADNWHPPGLAGGQPPPPCALRPLILGHILYLYLW